MEIDNIFEDFLNDYFCKGTYFEENRILLKYTIIQNLKSFLAMPI